MRRCVPLLLCLGSAPAAASGYYFSDSGIVATGRGGAWVAGADTQFAQRYNPAGLVRIERPTLNVGWSGVKQDVRFRRLKAEHSEGEDPFLPEVENEAAPFSIPQLGFATPVGDDFAFAFGFTSPFAPSSLYPEDGAQRYSIVDTLIYQFAIGPSAAWRPVPQVAVGVGLQWQFLMVGEELVATTSGNDDPAGDVGVEARVQDWFTPNANVGVIVEPVEQVSIGLSAQPPSKFAATGHATLDFTGNAFEAFLDQPTWTDDDVTLNLSLPWELRAGVAVRPVPTVEVETAFVYQTWSQLEDLLVEDIDVTITGGPIEREVPEELSLPAGFRDAWSLRLGGEVEVSELLDVRAGMFYETAALTRQTVSVALVDTPKVQVASGGSVHLLDGRLTLDAALAYLFLQDLEIRDSEVKQINANDEEGPAQIVGNGDLSSSGWIVGLQARWAFGRAPEEVAAR